MASVTYFYRGMIERWSPSRRGYVWRRGYSAAGERGGVLYPWSTRAECREEARREGATAEFSEQGIERPPSR